MPGPTMHRKSRLGLLLAILAMWPAGVWGQALPPPPGPLPPGPLPPAVPAPSATPREPDPGPIYAQVERYLGQGAYQAAIEALARLTLAEHQTWRYHFYDGRVYLGLKQYVNAIDQFSRAATLRQNDPQIYLYWGDVYAAMKYWEQAMIKYRGATTLAPGSALAHYKIGTVAMVQAQAERMEQKRQGLLNDAERAFKQAVAAAGLSSAQRYDAWMQLGNIYQEGDRTQEAERAWRQALTQRGLSRSQSGKAYRQLGTAQLARRNWSAALASLRHATDLDPGDAASWVGLGLAQIALQKVPEASHSFNQALRANPDYAQGYNGLGIISLYGGDAKEAVDHFATMLKLAEKRYTPDIRELTATAAVNRGAAQELQGEIVEAKKGYQNALERWSGSLPARVNLGNLALREGDPGQALREFQKVEKRLSDNPSYLLSLGTVYLHLGHVQRALAAFDQALRQDSHDRRGVLGTALGHFVGRRWAEAAAAAEKVLAAEPGNELAWFLLDAVAARDEHLAAGLRERLVSYHRAAAERAAQHGQKRQAEFHLGHVLALQPADRDAARNLAQLRLEDGRLLAALAVFQGLATAGVNDTEVTERLHELQDRIKLAEEEVSRPVATPAPTPSPAPTESPEPAPTPALVSPRPIVPAAPTPRPTPHPTPAARPTVRPPSAPRPYPGIPPAVPAPTPTPSMHSRAMAAATPPPTAQPAPAGTPPPAAQPSPVAAPPPAASPVPATTPPPSAAPPAPNPSAVTIAPPQRPKLALLPVQALQWQLLGATFTSFTSDGPALGLAALGLLRGELEARSRLELVDAANADRALQQFNVTSIGLPDATSLVRVGQATEARMMVLPTIDEIGNRMSGRVRIVEVGSERSLRLLTTQTVGGDRMGRLRRVVQQLAEQIQDRLPLEASIVQVLTPQEVVLNAGLEHGVQVKDSFEVWRPSAVPGHEDKWADVRIVAVSPNRSRGLVVPFGRASADLVVGDRARTRQLQ